MHPMVVSTLCLSDTLNFLGQAIAIDHYVSEEITVIDQSSIINPGWNNSTADASTSSVSASSHRIVPQVKRSIDKSVIEMGESSHVKLFKCKYCDFKALTSIEESTHRYTTHTDELPYTCPVDGCIYRNKYNWGIKKHINSFHTEEKKFKCDICDYAAKTASEVKKHFQSDHEGRKRTCEICDFQCPYKNRSAMVRHLETAHGILDSSILKCDFCDFTTSQSRQILVDHINAKHAKAVIYQCSMCSYTTYTHNSLKAHEENRHNRNGSQVEGDISHVQGSGNVVMPKRGIPRFWCSVCGSVFTSEDLTLLHIHETHDISENATPVPTQATKPGTLYFKCSKCEEKFTSKLNAEQHVASEHDGGVLEAQFEEDANYSERIFQCKQCPYKTKALCGLRSHMRAKHQLKLIRCHLCNFGTMHRNALTSHMIRHHGASPSPQALSKAAKRNKLKHYRKGVQSSSRVEVQPNEQMATPSVDPRNKTNIAGDMPESDQ